MDLRTTLTVLGAAIVLTVLFGWRGARPWDIRKGPRLMPWRLLMLLAATAAFYMFVHVINLLGVVTGR